MALHPLAASSRKVWRNALAEFGGVDARYAGRARAISALTMLCSGPRILESIRFGRRIEATQILQDPVFIIGFYRSGTTFLHQLLASDPHLGSASTLHVIFPDLSLGSGLLRSVLRTQVGGPRGVDRVVQTTDLPEDDEPALANLTTCAFHHGLYFPRSLLLAHRRYVMFEGVGEAAVESWKDSYFHFVKKLTFCSSGRRLVLKNPPHAARIPILREMFPDARFIYIHRDPYSLHPSLMHWLEWQLRSRGLQEVDLGEAQTAMMRIYEEVTRKYLKDRDSIPDRRLCEVSFEELEADPLGVAKTIYESLSLELGPETRAGLEQHRRTVDGYQKNEYRVDPDSLMRVREHWGWAAEEWGYEPPDLAARPVTPADASHTKVPGATDEGR